MSSIASSTQVLLERAVLCGNQVTLEHVTGMQDKFRVPYKLGLYSVRVIDPATREIAEGSPSEH